VNEEAHIVLRVRQALNESASRLEPRLAVRLHEARQAALARHAARATAPSWVPSLALAPGGTAGEVRPGWAWRVGLAIPVFALALAFVAIYDWRNEQAITEMAEIDFAVLMDDTPIDTYAHRGFGVLLQDPDAI